MSLRRAPSRVALAEGAEAHLTNPVDFSRFVALEAADALTPTVNALGTTAASSTAAPDRGSREPGRYP